MEKVYYETYDTCNEVYDNMDLNPTENQVEIRKEIQQLQYIAIEMYLKSFV